MSEDTTPTKVKKVKIVSEVAKEEPKPFRAEPKTPGQKAVERFLQRRAQP